MRHHHGTLYSVKAAGGWRPKGGYLQFPQNELQSPFLLRHDAELQRPPLRRPRAATLEIVFWSGIIDGTQCPPDFEPNPLSFPPFLRDGIASIGRPKIH